MKKILTILLMLFSSVIQATVYHVKADGTGDITFAQASTNTFAGDDQILFNRGDIFYGTLTIHNSGTSGHPIIYGAYGTGVNPIITGFTNVTAWTNLGSNIWESTNSISALSTCDMVAINGANIPMGRYPNSGYFPYQSFSTNTSITSSSVNSSTTNWTGAEVVIKKQNWIIDRYPITSHSGGTITYSNGSFYDGQNNFGFFIQNDIRTLDVQNEWYYNPSTKKISIYSTSQPENVKVSTIDKLVTIAEYAYINIDGISFIGSNTDAISVSNTAGNQNISILNCTINYSGRNAVVATNSTYLTIQGNTINNSNNNAVQLDGQCSYASILNNSINNTALIPGMGVSSDGTYQSIYTKGSNTLIENNTIDSTGFNGISFKGNSVIVKNNFVSNSCIVKDDGAGIYTYLGEDESAQTNRQIVGNIVLNSIGNSVGTSENNTRARGIYLDGSAANVDIIGNTVANCTNYGIYASGSKNIKIKNNTLYNNEVQLYFWNWGPGITGINAKNNIYFSKYSSQLAWSFYTEANDITNFGVSDSNYYARPFDNKLLIHTTSLTVDGYLSRLYNLAAWQSEYNQDQHSINLSNIKYEYTYNSIGSNKYANEQFISNVNELGYDYCTPSWVNDGQLDDGYLRINNPTADRGASVQFNIGAISSTKTYILKFSSKSSKSNSYLNISMVTNNSPYAQTVPQFTYLNTDRVENQLLIKPTYDNSSVSVMFELDNGDQTVRIDNFQLYEVDTTMINTDDYIKFYYNETQASKVIALTTPMIDVKGTKYANSITLQPFTSAVLMVDPSPAGSLIFHNGSPLFHNGVIITY